jgi:hypothetical protein
MVDQKNDVSRPNPAAIDLQRSLVALSPAPPDFSQQSFAVLRHLLDQGTRRFCVLVPRSPNQQLQQHRRQINTFLCKAVIYPSPVRFVHLGRDYSCGFELLKPVCQDIRRHALTRFFKFLERPIASDHEIADDQERPAVPKNLQRNAYWTARSMFRLQLLRLKLLGHRWTR